MVPFLMRSSDERWIKILQLIGIMNSNLAKSNEVQFSDVSQLI